MKFNVKHITVLAIAILVLQACGVTKKYQSPADVLPEGLYRIDSAYTDTTNIATLSWKEFFTDELLKKHIDEAIANNLDIKIAMENIRVAEAYLRQGRAAYFPSLNIGPAVSYQTNSLNTQFGQIIGDRRHIVQYELGSDFSWEADIWGRLRSNEKAVAAEALGSYAAKNAVLSRVVTEVADSYYRLLSLDKQKFITDSTILNRRNNLEVTKALKTAGTLTEVAVKQSEAQVLNAEAISLNIDNEIRLLENYICLLLSKPSAPIERSALDSQVFRSDLHVGLPAQLLRNRPDVLTAEFNYVNAFELTNVARASFYPSLLINGSFGFQSIDIQHLINPISFFGNAAASLLQPITNRKQIRTQKEVREAQQQSALFNYKNTILTAARDVSDAINTYETQTKLADIKQLEFMAYDTATMYSQELVNYGMANYLEVLRATENSLQAQLSYINARYGRLSAMVQLYRALGGGWR